jgi:hypothetical protein
MVAGGRRREATGTQAENLAVRNRFSDSAPINFNKVFSIYRVRGEGTLPINLDALVINIIVSTIIVSPALWLSGRLVVGKEQAKFGDAVLTVVVGTVVGGIFGAFFTGVIASIVQLVLWLGLVRHYFECGWIAALGISILAVILFIIVAVALGLVGITLFTVFF